MQKITITDPNNITYPFSKEIYENPNIVYHGTSSCYSERIEKNGWKINGPPYNMEEIQYICELFEKLDYIDNDYSILRPYTLGSEDYYVKYKAPSFTLNYWIARNFASKPGGETVEGLINASRDFLQLLDTQERIEMHKEKLNSELNRIRDMMNKIKETGGDYGSIINDYKRYKRALEMLNDTDFLETHYERFQRLHKKYQKLRERVQGVVYAVQIKPDWFQNWMDPENVREMGLNTDFYAAQDITPEKIIAKITYPNGIRSYWPSSNVPRPLPWKMDKFKTYVSNHSRFFNEKIRKKYSE